MIGNAARRGPGHAVIVGDHRFDNILNVVETALTQQGHLVTRHRGTLDELAALPLWATADALLMPGMLACSRETIAAAPNLRGIISPYIGTEGIDEKAATDLGVVVGNCQTPENYESVAESTILLMLASLYRLHGKEKVLRDNLPMPSPIHQGAATLRGKKIGLIGFGKIAQSVAVRLSTWSLTIQVYMPRVRPPLPSYITCTPLEELLRTSDVVAVLASLNDETRHMLNAERLALMKPGAVLINTSRGALIDENALYDLAKDGHFGAVALDVFEAEPLSPNSPLRRLPNTILTPHCIAATQELLTAVHRASTEDMLRLLDGKAPQNVRNPDVLPIWEKRWSARQTI